MKNPETKSPSRANKMGRYIKYTMIGLCIVLVCLFAFLVRDYRTLRREQIISAQKIWLMAVVKNHGHLPTSDATAIRPWMTFDYVNKLFALPPDYLKNQFTVTNSHYPQITLSGYANTEHLTVMTFVANVEDAIRSYSATSSPSGEE